MLVFTKLAHLQSAAVLLIKKLGGVVRNDDAQLAPSQPALMSLRTALNHAPRAVCQAATMHMQGDRASPSRRRSRRPWRTRWAASRHC